MRQKLGEMLIEAGAIDEMQLRSALADQRRWGRPLGKTLVELRLIREEDLVRVLARQLGLPFVEVDQLAIPPDILALVPEHLARQHQIIPVGRQMKFLDVAMADPTNLGIIDEIRIRTQLNPRPVLSGPRMIERAIEHFYGTATRMPSEVAMASSPGEHPLDVPVPEIRDGLRTYRASTGSQPPPVSAAPARDREIDALQERISNLEALVQRDEQVLRKLLALLIDKGIATRDEIVERLG